MPNPKLQIPNKFQNLKPVSCYAGSRIVWNLFVLEALWDVGFGIWNFPRPWESWLVEHLGRPRRRTLRRFDDKVIIVGDWEGTGFYDE